MKKGDKKQHVIKGRESPLSSMMKNLGITVGVLFSVVLIVTILGINFGLNQTTSPPSVSPGFLSGYEATLYTTPECSCCHRYVEYMTEYSKVDLSVVQLNSSELYEIKDSRGIKVEQRACHTVLFKDFFVEGHVNLEAIEAFINGGYVNDAKGLILPGMPLGSPGMGGTRTGYTVLLMTSTGDTVDFMSF